MTVDLEEARNLFFAIGGESAVAAVYGLKELVDSYREGGLPRVLAKLDELPDDEGFAGELLGVAIMLIADANARRMLSGFGLELAE